MNLNFLLERYTYYSQKASDVARQLGFAGIALIWIFRSQVNNQWQIPRELYPGAIFIIVALVLDFLHYVAGSLIWSIYHTYKERAEKGKNTEFLAPGWINYPTLVFFWGKLIAMGVGYCFILRFLTTGSFVER